MPGRGLIPIKFGLIEILVRPSDVFTSDEKRNRMDRRDTLLAISALGAAPFCVQAQPPPLPVIGFLNAASAEPAVNLVAGFRRGLAETGFVEGRNVAIEFRWANGRYERLPEMAQSLVQRPLSVLVTGGGEVAALAAKGATSTIPIVFVMGSDPVALGLVRSFNKPGGNLTGVAQLTTILDAKRLELIHSMVPAAKIIAAIFNPDRVIAKSQLQDVEEGARRLGVRIIPFQARAEPDFETAFAAMAQQRVGALLVGADPFFFSQRERLVALAARFKLPAIYEFTDFTTVGGLMSFGTDLADSYRQLGVYAGRILKGAKPGDIPVVQPTRFKLVVNRNTASSLGIKIPQSILQRADEIIE